MKILAFWHPRGRGVFLTIMAVPLFVTVYFLIFLDLDIMNAQTRSGSPPNYGATNGRSFIKTIAKMQRALDDLGLDLSNVISHRDHIRVRIRTLINETTQWSKPQYFVDEIQMVLDNTYFHNYTSVVKQRLLINCNQIEAIQQLSKPKWRDVYSYTEEGLYGFKQVKTIRSRTDLKTCSAVSNTENSKACRIYANNLALRDIMLFQQLQHAGIGKLIGYCIREFTSGVSYVIENGKNINITEISSNAWRKRVQILLDLIDLMSYLLQSPIGTLRLQSMRPSSFMMNGDSLELWDLSSVSFGEPRCQDNSDCKLNNSVQDVPCDGGYCKGLSLKQMLLDAKVNFFNPLLQKSPPEQVQNVKYLLRMLHRSHLKLDDVIELLKKMGASPRSKPTEKAPPDTIVEELVPQDPEENQVWQTGQDSYTYRKLVNTDLPGHHDYACPRSQVTWGCVVAMPSRDSAFRRCSGDPQCRAFVILPNSTINGWSNVCYKNGYVDLVDSPDSTLYIKVPMRDSNDDLRFWHYDLQGREDGEPDVDNLKPCLLSTFEKQTHIRTARESRLMALLDMPELSENEWFTSIESGIVTSTDALSDGVFVRRYNGPGGSLVLHMSAAVVKEVNLIVKQGPTQFQDAHLLFYYVDRLLGFYLTPPTKQRIFSKEEVNFMLEEVPGFRRKFASFIKDGALRGVLTAVSPVGTVGVNHLSISPLSNVTSSIVPFSRLQQNHLEYILLLWLTGTPRYLSEVQNSKGILLHLDSSDAIQQGVDTLLPYLYHCQYPRHIVELLQMLQTEQNKSPSCSFSNQLFYKLHQDNIQINDLRLLFKGLQQLANLLSRSSEKFLDIVNICIDRFGESQVLYK